MENEPDYIKKLRENCFNNDLRTPARVNREKGVIEVDKKVFEDWNNSPAGKAMRFRMNWLYVQGSDYWMYNKKIRRKKKIKEVYEFIQWLQRKADQEVMVNKILSTEGHLYSAKIMEIKHSFRFRLFWYKLYLGIKTFLTKELLHFQNFFNFKTPSNGKTDL